MNPSFDAQAYLSALTNDPRVFKGRLAGGGNALGMSRPTAELLQEYLYPDRADAPQAHQCPPTEVALEQVDALPWEEGLPPEDAQHRIDLMQAHARSLVRAQRIARAAPSSAHDEANRITQLSREPGGIDWCSDRPAHPLGPGAHERSRTCVCPGIESIATVTDLLLSFEAALRLTRLLADANVIAHPPRPPPLMIGKTSLCPCSLMGPTAWAAFIAHLMSSPSASDAFMHPSQLADAEQYVRRVHIQFRNAILGQDSERRRMLAHASFLAKHPQAISRGITDPERTQSMSERQHIRATQHQKTQHLAASRAPNTKDRTQPSREDQEQDAELKWQTQIFARKFTKNNTHTRGVFTQ